MPHLVILYSPNLDAANSADGLDMTALCRALADTLLAGRDDADAAVFPPAVFGCWPTRPRTPP